MNCTVLNSYNSSDALDKMSAATAIILSALSSAAALFQVVGALGGSSDDFTVLISATGKGLGIRRDVSRTMSLTELLNMVKR